MKFMCQVWHDGSLIDAMASDEKQALDRANLAHDAELRRRGHLVLSQALQSPKTAVTVRVRDGKVSVTDGPFIETKEHLGGFILIEAEDIDEALRLIARDPMALTGSIEVRPVMARTVTDGAYDYGSGIAKPEELTMRYLCQVWFDGTRLDAMSAAEKQKLDRDSLAYDKELERTGHFIAAEALQSPRSARTVKVRDGQLSTTDGPFIETKEHLGGFILIEAAGMDEAIRIAAGIPLAKIGGIEVRPIYEFG